MGDGAGWGFTRPGGRGDTGRRIGWRFPYAVFSLVERRHIEALAGFHTRRDPKKLAGAVGVAVPDPVVFEP